jgi:hypothetical protein
MLWWHGQTQHTPAQSWLAYHLAALVPAKRGELKSEPVPDRGLETDANQCAEHTHVTSATKACHTARV